MHRGELPIMVPLADCGLQIIGVLSKLTFVAQWAYVQRRIRLHREFGHRPLGQAIVLVDERV